jgi:hypothetical protein
MATPHPDQHWTNWLCITIFFAVLFSYPLLQVFNRTTLIFGVPLLIIFLLLGWLLFIWTIYRFSCRLPKGKGTDDAGRGEEQKHS